MSKYPKVMSMQKVARREQYVSMPNEIKYD